MARVDFMARYRELELRAEALAAGNPPPAAGPARPSAPTRPQPTEVHRQTVALLDELLATVAPSSGPFATIVRTLRRLEGPLLADLADVPPDKIVAMLHELGRRMLAVGAPPALFADPGNGPAEGTPPPTLEAEEGPGEAGQSVSP